MKISIARPARRCNARSYRDRVVVGIARTIALNPVSIQAMRNKPSAPSIRGSSRRTDCGESRPSALSITAKSLSRPFSSSVLPTARLGRGRPTSRFCSRIRIAASCRLRPSVPLTQLERSYAGAKHGGAMRPDASQLPDLDEHIDGAEVVRSANEIQCHAFRVTNSSPRRYRLSRERDPQNPPLRHWPLHFLRIEQADLARLKHRDRNAERMRPDHANPPLLP